MALLALLLVLVLPQAAFGAFGLTKLRDGGPAGAENYSYAVNGVAAPEGTTDSSRYYRFVAKDSSGATRWMSLCQWSTGGTVSASYAIPAAAPVSTGTAWSMSLEQFRSSAVCTGSPEKTQTKYFTVARLSSFADDALTIPRTSFDPGSTVRMTIAGLGKVETGAAVAGEPDWDVTWYTPSGAVACANTGGGKRPDSTNAGLLPDVAGDHLRYRPDTGTGGEWNQENDYDVKPCADLTVATLGTWRLRLEKDAKHFVEMDAFTVGIPAQPSIDSEPPSPGNDLTPTWAFSGEAGSFDCRLETGGGATVGDWATCTSPKTYDLTGQPDGTYRFLVRARDASGTTYGPSAGSEYVLDTTVPAVPVVTPDGGPVGNDPAPSWSFTGEAGATFECRLTRGGTTISGWGPCGSPFTANLTAEPDGTYTLAVRATDTAGNQGPVGSADHTLDRVAPPAATIDSAPPPTIGTDSATWLFSGEAGDTFRCRLETSGGATVYDWAACASPHSYDLTSLPDGDYTFSVVAVDAAGNAAPAATSDFTLDRVGPAAPVFVTTPPATGFDDAPQWTFTLDAGTTPECRIVRGTTVIQDWAACSSPFTADLSAEPDGDYTISVRSVDGASNVGQAVEDDYTLDRSPPAAPVIADTPGGLGNDPTPSWSFTGEAGATLECRLERDGTTLVEDWTTCTSPHTHDLTGEPDGSYSLSVHAVDAAGNVGPAASDVYDLDRAPPAAPVLVSTPPAIGADSEPAWGFTGEANAGFECRLERGGTVVSDWIACSSPEAYALEGEPDGDYDFFVRSVDVAGNTGTATQGTYTLDRSVPSTPSIDAAPPALGADRSPEWSFSGDAGSTFRCRVERGGTVVSDWSACASPYTADLALQPDGVYTFSVAAVNTAGTWSAAATSDYELDTTAPAAPSIDSAPTSPSADPTPEWSFSGEPGASFECRLERGGTPVADWGACSSPQGYDLTTELDGSYDFLVRAADAAGNTGPTATGSFDLDRTVPAAPSIDADPGATGADRTPTWSFSGSAASFECRLDRGATVIDGWSPCASPKTYDLTLETDGTYTFSVRGVSGTGVAGPAAAHDYLLDTAAPAAPSITSAPSSPAADPAPQWSFAGEPGASFECRVDRGGTVVAGWAACSTPYALDLTSEPDGTYDFSVRATDAAGNTSGATTSSYTLDRTVPPAPTFDVRPASPSSGRSPSWSFSGSGASFECRLDAGATTISGWAACTSPFTADLSSAADATYTLSVRAIGGTGLAGPAATDDYVLDSTAPAAPAITGGPGAIGNASSPSWSFTSEPGVTTECRLRLDGAVVRAWAACSSPRSYDLGGEPDGPYAFDVRAIDGAGNTGPAASAEYRLDRVAPAPPAIVAGPGPRGNTRTPSWTFTGEPGAAFECRLDTGAPAADGWASCGSPHAHDLTGRADGRYGLGVRAVDAAGNRSDATVAPYELDTSPAAISITSGPGPLGRTRTPTWTWTAEPGAFVECGLALAATPLGAWGACATPRQFDLAGQPDGVFRFSLRAADPVGNAAPPIGVDYELDTTPPDPPAIDRAPDSPDDDRSPTWRFSSEPGATFDCRVARGTDSVVDWRSCDSPFTAALSGEDDGDFRFLVRATDRAGNAGKSAIGTYELRTKRDEPAPTTPAPPPVATPTPAPKRAEPRDKAPASPKRETEPAARKPKRDRAPAAGRRPARRVEPVRRSEAKPEPREKDKASPVTQTLKNVGRALVENPDKSVFPASLLLLVAAFLVIQNRIDRSDPKLVLAPRYSDPDLPFGPSPGTQPD